MRSWDRYLAGLMGLAFAANGLAMLFASLAWYDTVPGVPTTGPFNPHFVKDIGAIYVACALALGWFAWRPRQGWPAMAVAAATCLKIFMVCLALRSVCVGDAR